MENYSFNKVPIFCTSGVHESIFSLFLSNNPEKKAKILVLGSGAGAFERRLIDHGFNNIVSVEFVPENFLVKEIKPLSIDLNKNFNYLGKFDFIFAIEIIEHLENHFHFIRSIKELMLENSIFYLSTPNVESSFSRFKYCFIGRLHWFGDKELFGTGHINPVFLHILKFNLSQNNLVIIKHIANDSIWNKLFNYKNILIRLLYFFVFLLTLFIKNKNNKEINIFEISLKK